MLIETAISQGWSGLPEPAGAGAVGGE